MWAPLGTPHVRLGQLVASLSYLAVQGDKAVSPDVLSKDLTAYIEAERTGDGPRMQTIEQRAVRRGKKGFVVKDQIVERLRRLFSDRLHGEAESAGEFQQRHFHRPHFRMIDESRAVLVKARIVRYDLPPTSHSTGIELE